MECEQRIDRELMITFGGAEEKAMKIKKELNWNVVRPVLWNSFAEARNYRKPGPGPIPSPPTSPLRRYAL
ncbi:hypothetical protein J6590_085985 [Homalodisca vitripennis]|nr:hypothetical protein J6590_085985 [Homalodisca vitripennis]